MPFLTLLENKDSIALLILEYYYTAVKLFLERAGGGERSLASLWAILPDTLA